MPTRILRGLSDSKLSLAIKEAFEAAPGLILETIAEYEGRRDAARSEYVARCRRIWGLFASIEAEHRGGGGTERDLDPIRAERDEALARALSDYERAMSEPLPTTRFPAEYRRGAGIRPDRKGRRSVRANAG